MSDFSSIGQDRGIIHTCNCGWFDRGHAFLAPSKRPTVGPFHLWNRLLKEDGPPEVIGRVHMPGFVVTYRQDAVKKVAGVALFPGVERQYVVRRGLSNVRKQGVALAIVMEVSMGFEKPAMKGVDFVDYVPVNAGPWGY